MGGGISCTGLEISNVLVITSSKLVVQKLQ